MKSEGNPGNGSPKPGRNKDAAQEKCIVVDSKDNFCTCEGKADALDAAEGRRLEGVMGEEGIWGQTLIWPPSAFVLETNGYANKEIMKW